MNDDLLSYGDMETIEARSQEKHDQVFGVVKKSD